VPIAGCGGTAVCFIVAPSFVAELHPILDGMKALKENSSYMNQEKNIINQK